MLFITTTNHKTIYTQKKTTKQNNLIDNKKIPKIMYVCVLCVV